MRHLLVFAVLLLACDNVFSQPSEDMLNNVIQITTTFSNGEKDFGFGFVVAQRNDVLYFVTAKHVVQKDDPDITSQKIEVRFYSDKGKIVVATKLDLPHKDMDIALLEVPKPQSYSFVNECLADCAFKDEVYFIGRKKDWYFPMGNQTGNIINSLSDEGTIKVAITSIRPGTSGAPLLNSSGIVGMVIRDSDDNEADAIGIKIIKDVIEKTWKYPFQLTDVKKGRFTDQRDDPAIYKWVRIKNETWMAENMNFKTDNSFCYEKSNGNCEEYGRLYLWKGIDSICPPGWRVASKEDFDKLLKISYEQLIYAGSSGFSARFSGWRSLNGNFNNLGDASYFWSNTENDANSAWALVIDGNSATAKTISLNRSCALSVRCIKKDED